MGLILDVVDVQNIFECISTQANLANAVFRVKFIPGTHFFRNIRGVVVGNITNIPLAVNRFDLLTIFVNLYLIVYRVARLGILIFLPICYKDKFSIFGLTNVLCVDFENLACRVFLTGCIALNRPAIKDPSFFGRDLNRHPERVVDHIRFVVTVKLLTIGKERSAILFLFCINKELQVGGATNICGRVGVSKVSNIAIAGGRRNRQGCINSVAAFFLNGRRIPSRNIQINRFVATLQPDTIQAVFFQILVIIHENPNTFGQVLQYDLVALVALKVALGKINILRDIADRDGIRILITKRY